ncbi:RNA-directed DNA polymerase, eukaryota [Tanacetum coccineum]
MGYDDWQEVSRKKRGYKSKENDVAKISTSIFVTNFPESTSAKDLFNACKVYGHVVDSFIPNKRAKNGKRFAFIRFINVFSVERLVSNLCTVWIEKHRLQANLAKYNRPSVNQNVKEVKSKNNYNTHKVGVSSRPSVSSVPTHVKGQANSFANVVNGTTSGTQGIVRRRVGREGGGDGVEPEVVWVVGDGGGSSKFIQQSRSSSITDLQERASADGHILLWLLLEFINVETKENFMRHSGINSMLEKRFKKALQMVLLWERIFGCVLRGISHSDDPFEIYKILNNKNRESSPSLSHPPGFTPEMSDKIDEARDLHSASVGSKSVHNGGSVLGVMEDVIFEFVKAKGYIYGRYLSRRNEYGRWNGELIVMGDFNEVRSSDERRGSCFNPYGAKYFDRFISNSGLVDVILEGYAFTWSHPTGAKMSRFKEPTVQRLKLNFQFPRKLLISQADDLEREVSREEIRRAVWNCGDNKSPGPDGYTFEFFKKYWDLLGSDFCGAVESFFVTGDFSKRFGSLCLKMTPYGGRGSFIKLKGKGFDFWSHVKKRIGNGADTRFWFDQWLGDSPLCVKYPRLFALEMDKHASVESKLHSSVSNSFRRMVRGGIEQQFGGPAHDAGYSVSLSNSNDRWVFDLVSDGSFRVKETRNFIDNTFLPAQKGHLLSERFYGVFVSGGTYLRQVGIRFKIGSLGFFRSGFPTRFKSLLKTLSMFALDGRIWSL